MSNNKFCYKEEYVNVFSKTSGLTGENVSTEVLCHILSSTQNHRSFQKLFYYRVFGVLETTSAIDMELYTQVRFGDLGQPDIVCLSKDALIIIENKLLSGLSGSAQLAHYADLMTKEDILAGALHLPPPLGIHTRYLVVLCPAHILPGVLRDTSEHVRAEGLASDFDAYCSSKEVIFRTLTWETVIADLETGDSLQRELHDYVFSHLMEPLTKEELMILQNQEVPVALEKLFAKVRTIRDAFEVVNYRAARIGQSYNYYGFTIEHEYFSLWFGYTLPLWSQFKTPVFLQVRSDWIKANHERISTALRHVLKWDEQHQHVMPFELSQEPEWEQKLSTTLSILDRESRSSV